MIRSFALCLSIAVSLAATAQPPPGDRCLVTRPEVTERFESWISSIKSKSAFGVSVVYRIPVVVHVLHTGEALGEGFNFSSERILSQIRTLNEDFRRKEGTPGFNTHPDGADTRIEFVLAETDPQGQPTNGIVRLNRNDVHPPSGISDLIAISSWYSYWDPEQYLNIWCWDVGYHGIYAGKSTFPVSDLEGLSGQNDDPTADGIFINAINFGQGDTNTIPNLDRGRTLTHEMGHFLGLLHTFSSTGSCEYSDYCDDTPPISAGTSGCPSDNPAACDGSRAMIENYMDYSYDRCMNIFTQDQTARMRTVLDNSPRRKSLRTSRVIDRSGEVVTGIPDRIFSGVGIYPNPVTDKVIHVSVDDQYVGSNITVTATTITGAELFQQDFKIPEASFEIPISGLTETILVLTIKGSGLHCRQKVVVK